MRLQDLYSARDVLERNFPNHPEGKIHVIINKSRAQYYIRYNPTDTSGVYLPKNEKDKIRRYLQKQYDIEEVKIIDKEIKALEKMLEKSSGLITLERNYYSSRHEEIKQFINPIDVNDDDYIMWWKSIPYERKTINERLPLYITDGGEQVRSKSEVNIANKLFKMNIPYRYECPLRIDKENVIHPDFTILDVKRRCEVYWEHRGMMDDRDYSRHSVSRIRDYEKAGFFLGDKLIITEETSVTPLGTYEIERIISHYFG